MEDYPFDRAWSVDCFGYPLGERELVAWQSNWLGLEGAIARRDSTNDGSPILFVLAAIDNSE